MSECRNQTTGRFEIENPLVVMFRTEDKRVITHLYPADLGHKGYGLLICDLVRHVANAFQVDEDDVWEWVDKERRHHTTDIVRPS